MAPSTKSLIGGLAVIGLAALAVILLATLGG
jgi:hypothetical protein